MSTGVRSLMIAAYAVPREIFRDGIPNSEPKELPIQDRRRTGSAAYHLRQLGILLRYADQLNYMSHKKRTPMDIEAMIVHWKEALVGLCTAHDKDAADRYEASIESCLTPLLAAPIKQIREFSLKLAEALEADPNVPFLVHRSFRVWVEQMKHAPDEDVIELKTGLATEIVHMVEDDAKRDLPTAMIRALQWRSPSQLEEVKKVVLKEKEAGRGVRLRGRESCLFLEAGGTEADPEVCIQV